jgi:F-type H+-transporting ATPase subunit b
LTIDWFTVAAQVVNFLVLVWLLQRFLYGPITRAMAARQAAIADRLARADAAVRDANAQKHHNDQERAALAAEQERYLAEARGEAVELRRRLRAEVRSEIETMRRDWTAELLADRDTVLADVRRAIVERFETFAHAALRDLADAELEKQIARTFAERLRTLDDVVIHQLGADGGIRDRPVEIRSRFALGPDAQQRVTDAIHARLGPGTEVVYTRSDAIAGGLELRVDGTVVAWTLDRYLEDLDEHLREALATITAGRQRGEPG